jgi:hypothetical protein
MSNEVKILIAMTRPQKGKNPLFSAAMTRTASR